MRGWHGHRAARQQVELPGKPTQTPKLCWHNRGQHRVKGCPGATRTRQAHPRSSCHWGPCPKSSTAGAPPASPAIVLASAARAASSSGPASPARECGWGGTTTPLPPVRPCRARPAPRPQRADGSRRLREDRACPAEGTDATTCPGEHEPFISSLPRSRSRGETVATERWEAHTEDEATRATQAEHEEHADGRSGAASVHRHHTTQPQSRRSHTGRPLPCGTEDARSCRGLWAHGARRGREPCGSPGLTAKPRLPHATASASSGHRSFAKHHPAPCHGPARSEGTAIALLCHPRARCS